MKKISFIILSASLLLSGILFSRNLVLADSSLGTQISTSDISKSIGLQAGTLEIKTYQKNNEYTNLVYYKKSYFQQQSIVLSGFENDVFVCKDNPKLNISGSTMLCLSGFVGAHSENIELISLDKFQPVLLYKDNQTESNVYSDVPKFEFNSIGSTVSLTIENRNYDKDPIADVIADNYIWHEGSFVFDKTELIRYDSGN